MVRRHSPSILLGVFLLIAATLPACRNEDPRIAQLRAADVPVRALVHHSTDPAIAYPESFSLQVALYRSKPNESMLEMVHALREMGIPFFVTRDLDQALGHRLVIIYPTIEGTTFNEQQLTKLGDHIAGGGSIFAVDVLYGALKPLFGFHDTVASRRRYRVDFMAKADPILRYLNRPEELTVSLGSPKYGDIFWTNGYVPDVSATVLARFEDGTAALFRKSSGKGSAYVCGVSFHDAVLRNQVNRDYDAGRHYVNGFEPGADVWMLLLRAWYESNTPDAVRLASIPAGQSSVLLLSHDVDWGNSFEHALAFARMEASHNAKSTFFIQTKYVSDANSTSFFFGKNLEDLRELHSLGFSLGTHSVIHSRGFNHFKLGEGKETFPSYRPRGTGFDTAKGATVFGEVRVSKELLDGNVPGRGTVFFRAGHLRVPPSLPEALERTGYLFDSSFTAGDVLTNFPYALPLDLGFTEDSDLFEFPLTIEDEELPYLSQRVDRALEVIRANAENQAISVLLIHTNEAISKLSAEEALLRQLPSGVKPMDLESYARFWSAHERLSWSVEPGRGSSVIHLRVAAGERIDGATFEFQQEISRVDGGARLLPDRHRIILPELHAEERADFTIHYANSAERARRAPVHAPGQR